LVDLTEYSGVLYVAAGASSNGQIYIYNDPIGQYNTQQGAIVPSQVLNVPQANYLSFSDNAQFIVAENGTDFGVYDIENSKAYSYVTNLPLDMPQQHATWMDGDRLLYASGSKLIVFDYDDTNQQTLMPSSGSYIPAFDANYHYAFTVAVSPKNGKYDLDQTPLLTPADI
jgi:WD40 repeat protein